MSIPIKTVVLRTFAILSAIFIAWLFWPREIVVSVTSATGVPTQFELRSIGARPAVYRGRTPAVVRLRTGVSEPSVIEVDSRTGRPLDDARAEPAPGASIDVRVEVGSRTAWARGKGVLLEVTPVSLAVSTPLR
ncbi:MAG: hypothetical protein WEF86_00600 [Gemmatimonadota bacterium]